MNMADSNISVQGGSAISGELPRSENELVTAVGQALAYGAGIKNPLVLRAYQGVVTLRGEVDTEETLALAEQVVLAVPGVKGVIDGFKVKSEVNSSTQELVDQPSFNFSRSSLWDFPKGELAIHENGVVYASDGKLGRIKGLVYQLPEGTVGYLIVERREGITKSWWKLPVKYLAHIYYNQYPEIYLKLNQAGFVALSQELANPDTNSRDKPPFQILIFGEKIGVDYQGEKLGWLGGVLLQRVRPSQNYTLSLSHYLIKSNHLKMQLLPFTTLEAAPDGQALHLVTATNECLQNPYQFNGFASPDFVVERALEILALTGGVQRKGSYLRVSYQQGEVTLQGMQSNKFYVQRLTQLVEKIKGVRRVNNLVEVALP